MLGVSSADEWMIYIWNDFALLNAALNVFRVLHLFRKSQALDFLNGKTAQVNTQSRLSVLSKVETKFLTRCKQQRACTKIAKWACHLFIKLSSSLLSLTTQKRNDLITTLRRKAVNKICTRSLAIHKFCICSFESNILLQKIYESALKTYILNNVTKSNLPTSRDTGDDYTPLEYIIDY